MDLQPYYSRDIDDKSDLWYDGITHEDFFKKLDEIRPTIIGGYNSAFFDWEWFYLQSVTQVLRIRR